MTQAEAEQRIAELEKQVAKLEAQMTLANALAECRNSFIEELLKRIPVTDKEAV